MYKCNHCGGYFGEPYIGEMEKETGYTPSGCPICGEPDDYEDADVCPCGEPIDFGEELCEDCKDELKAYMSEVQKKLGFDDDEFYSAIVWWIEET